MSVMRESLLLENVEEILHFQDAVVNQVGAVHCVLDFVAAEVGSDALWAHRSSQIRIVRPTQLPEGCYCVILSNFQRDTWSSGEFLCESGELGDNALVNFEEFLSSRAIQPEHLHCTDFEALRKDEVDDSTGTSLCHNVRLDDAAGAVIKEGWSLRESWSTLSLDLLEKIRSSSF